MGGVTGLTISEPLVLSSGSTLQNTSGIDTWKGTIALITSPDGSTDSTIDVHAGQLTISGAISGVTDLTKIGVGMLTLSVANTYSGQTNINQGLLNITIAGALGSLLGGTTVSSGAVLQIGSGITVTPELLTLNGVGNLSGIGNNTSTGGPLRHNLDGDLGRQHHP